MNNRRGHGYRGNRGHHGFSHRYNTEDQESGSSNESRRERGGSSNEYRRGRGGSSNESQRGRGGLSNESRRGRGGMPRGLKGKEIGLWFARRGRERKERLDISKRSLVTLDQKNEDKITSLLKKESPGESSSGVQKTMMSLNIKSPLLSNDDTIPVFPSSIQSRKCDHELDDALYNELLEKQSQNNFVKMQEFRKKLPSYKMKEQILDVIQNNQVVVVSGETGCGKTTQVAQFILDDYISKRIGSSCHVICTQPRRISAISVAERVAEERNEFLGKSVGYQIRLENKLPRTKGSMLYCTTGILLRQMISDPLMNCASHVILDEIHERDILSDFLMVVIKDLLVKRLDLKVILMSATLNAEMFSQYFHNCPMIHIPGYTFPVKEIYLPEIIEITRFSGKTQQRKFTKRLYGKRKHMKMEEEQKFSNYVNSLQNCSPYVKDILYTLDFDEFQYELIVSLINHICTHMQNGAILIFLPGWDQITKMHDMLLKNPVLGSDNFLLIPLHSLMPSANQREVFERPPFGKRKIIIATTIAETSITIDDVVYVIDCGKAKEKSYDIQNNISCLDLNWITKASATQRKGRAGRVQKGVCYRLYTMYHFEMFHDYQLPEMLRTPLESLCLQIKILGLGNIESFLCKSMQPPDSRAVHNALRSLKRMRAFDDEENLTALGYHLARLPVQPNVGRMILFRAMFSCLDPVLTIAASLDFKEPFYVPIHKEKEADKCKRELARGSKSDHIMLINAFKGWEDARQHGNEDQYCWHNFLSKRTLVMIDNMKRQFTEHLTNIGFTKSALPKDVSANRNSGNVPLIKAVVCAGLYPNVAKVVYTSDNVRQPPKIEAMGFGRAAIHPKSVNSNVTQFDTQWLIYHEKMKTTKLFLYDCSVVSPFALLFFGGFIKVHNEGGHETLEVDDTIKFHSPKRYAQLVKDLRKELDDLLRKKIETPSLDLAVGEMTSSRENQILNAIIELITTERFQVKMATDTG